MRTMARANCIVYPTGAMYLLFRHLSKLLVVEQTHFSYSAEAGARLRKFKEGNLLLDRCTVNLVRLQI